MVLQNTLPIFAPSDEVRDSSYDELAFHYYDQNLHPTCHALRAASKRLVTALSQNLPVANTIIELGAGKSIIPDALSHLFGEALRVILVDSSPDMLAHSSDLKIPAVESRVADAGNTGLPDGVADLIVASLADPFNTPALWLEVKRLLRCGGTAIFTTPSWRWARAFRPEGQTAQDDSSEFLTPSGEPVAVPSFVQNEADQRDLIERFGLVVEQVMGVGAREIPEAAAAPKLAAIDSDIPFAAGYLVRG